MPKCNFNKVALQKHLQTTASVSLLWEITTDLRITDQRIISCKKPHKAVITSTISRWCKIILGKAEIDIEKYSLHSARSASTSKAKIKRLSVSKTNRAAGWKETLTFRRFHQKPIYKILVDLVTQWHDMVNQTQSRYLIYIMLAFRKFSMGDYNSPEQSV